MCIHIQFINSWHTYKMCNRLESTLSDPIAEDLLLFMENENIAASVLFADVKLRAKLESIVVLRVVYMLS